MQRSLTQGDPHDQYVIAYHLIIDNRRISEGRIRKYSFIPNLLYWVNINFFPKSSKTSSNRWLLPGLVTANHFILHGHCKLCFCYLSVLFVFNPNIRNCKYKRDSFLRFEILLVWQFLKNNLTEILKNVHKNPLVASSSAASPSPNFVS